MKPALIVLTGLLWSACLVRDEVGLEPGTPDAGCASRCEGGLPVDDRIREEVARIIDELSRGPWIGQATSGSVSIDVWFEFEKNGEYVARCPDEREVVECRALFPSNEDGVVRGRYELSADNLHGVYYGEFHDPFPGGSVNSDFTELSVTGDTLRFARHLISLSGGPDGGFTGTLVFLNAQMVLERGP